MTYTTTNPVSRTMPSAFGEILAGALRERGMTLKALQQRLADSDIRLSVATLSYWSSGRSLPRRADSLRAVGLIEQELELPEGSLAGLLTTRPSDVRQAFAGRPWTDEVATILEDFGLAMPGPVTTVMQHDLVVVDDPPGTERECIRQLVRAEIDGLERIPSIHLGSHPGDAVPRITAPHGVTIGRTRDLGTLPGQVAELVLPRPLPRGATLWLGYEVLRPRSTEDPCMQECTLGRTADFLVQEVLFTGPLPRAAGHVFVPTGQTTGVDLVELDPGKPRLCHITRSASPGRHMMLWCWDHDGIAEFAEGD